MNRISRSLDISLAILVLALAFALPALAGGAGGDKCRHDSKASHAEKVAAMKASGWSGIEAEQKSSGYVITAVHPESPAARAGVREGDRLVAYQGIELAKENHHELKKAKKSRGVGSEVTYTLARGGQARDVTLTLAEVPDAVLAEWTAETEERLASVD